MERSGGFELWRNLHRAAVSAVAFLERRCPAFSPWDPLARPGAREMAFAERLSRSTATADGGSGQTERVLDRQSDGSANGRLARGPPAGRHCPIVAVAAVLTAGLLHGADLASLQSK